MSNTLDETRDWFAARDGWNYVPATIGGLGAEAHYWWKYTISPEHGGRTYSAVHPYPPTRDGAAAAMPEGWFWMRDGAAVSHRHDGLLLKWTACQRGADNWRVVETPDTGDEIADRYALARLACEVKDVEAKSAARRAAGVEQ